MCNILALQRRVKIKTQKDPGLSYAFFFNNLKAASGEQISKLAVGT